MIKKAVAVLAGTMLFTPSLFAGYGARLCHSPAYDCLRVESGDSWQSLFPNEEERMLVKKVNRMNTPLHTGMKIAVPKDLSTSNLLSLSPFPQQIPPSARTVVKVDLTKLAWGAYDAQGNLLRWGPVSGGKNFCPDVGRGCRTPPGNYTVYSKQGAECISHKFPLETRGGARMPYCMHFHGGFALHGSAQVPGENASHGCVRLFTEDAMWLNQEFVDVGSTRVQIVR